MEIVIFAGILLKKIKNKISQLDYFELGNSFLIYYVFIFFLFPLILLFKIPSKYVDYFLSENIEIFNFKVFLYLAMGMVFFVLGNKLLFRGQRDKSYNLFNYELDFNRAPTAFIFVFVLNFINKFIRILGGGYFHLSTSSVFSGSNFYSLIGLFDWFGPLALALAFVYYFRLLTISDKRYKIWRIIAWATFIFEFLYGFLSGSKYRAIIPIIVYLIIRHYIYRKNFLRVFVVVCLILAVLMPVMNFYRNRKAFYDGYLGDGNKKIYGTEQFIIDSSFSRISQSRIIYNVFERTKEFTYGKNLANFFVSLGPPRFLWKNKPVINASGNEFGRKYGILSVDDFGTSVAPTAIGDLYMNFGLAGIVFGMFLIGVLFRFIFDFFIKGEKNIFGVVIYSVFWIQIIKGMEDWIAPVYAGLVKLFIIFLIINYFFKKKKLK